MAFSNLKHYPASNLTTSEVVWVQIGTGGVINLSETSAPSATTGYGKLYVKSSDKKLYFKDSSGVEYNLLSGGMEETDPVFSAWDKSTGISISKSQIYDFGNYIEDAPSDNKLYGRKNASWVEVEGIGGSVSWGSITGTLSDQTDLQNALDGKQPLNEDLTAIASLSGTNGLLRKTGENTWELDTNTYLTSVSWGSITGTLSDQTDLKNALDEKASVNKSNITIGNFVVFADENGTIEDAGTNASEFASVYHNHTKSEITDLETITTTPTASSIPKADTNGKIDNGWLNTGTGNGLDADTIDGKHASVFAVINEDTTITGGWSFTPSTDKLVKIKSNNTSSSNRNYGILITGTSSPSSSWQYPAILAIDAESPYGANITASNNGGQTLCGFIISNLSFEPLSYSNVNSFGMVIDGSLYVKKGTGTIVNAGALRLVAPSIGTNNYALHCTGNVYISGTLNSLSIPSSNFVGTSDSQTLTNKRINPRVYSTTSTSSLTPDISSYDAYHLTALAENLSIGAPTGTSNDGNKLIFRIKDNGTSRTLTWNSIYRASSDLSLPTATTAGKVIYLGFIYNSADTKWDLVAKLDNF
ncbi:MAG: hypothetical protein QW469_00470 [Candidatus Aenigmatarchaeota archaeon]